MRIKWDHFEIIKWLHISVGILFTGSLWLIITLIQKWNGWNITQRVGIILIICTLEGIQILLPKITEHLQQKHIIIRK